MGIIHSAFKEIQQARTNKQIATYNEKYFAFMRSYQTSDNPKVLQKVNILLQEHTKFIKTPEYIEWTRDYKSNIEPMSNGALINKDVCLPTTTNNVFVPRLPSLPTFEQQMAEQDAIMAQNNDIASIGQAQRAYQESVFQNSFKNYGYN